MGFGIKLSKPKIKVSAPKAVTKAISSVTKPLETATKGALKSTGDIAKSALKGDIKGAASGALGAVDSLKEAGKQLGSGQLGFATDALGAVGGLTGSRDISKLAGNINREGNKGIEQYNDIAMEGGANAVLPGYSAIKAGVQGLASDGLKGILSGKGLQQAALQAAGSYAGVDPNILQNAEAGLKATQGDLKGAALQAAGSYGGFSPKALKAATTGLSAVTGDKAGLASGLASQFGAGDMASGMIGKFAGGKSAREVVSDQAGAYAEDAANQALDESVGRAGMDRGQVKELQQKMEQVKRAPAAMKDMAEQQYKIAKGDSFNAIAKKLGVSPEALKAANPNLKDISKIAAGANLNIPRKGETPEQTAARRAAADERAIANQQQEPGFFDTVKNKVGSALGSAKDFIADNKTGLSLGAQGIAAGAGYLAGQAGREEATGLQKKQLADLQAAGKEFQQMKYDPSRYNQEKEFLEQGIAGGGATPVEKKMQQEGDIRAARAAAAQRLAGKEQIARMGGRVSDSGAALAASLMGGQSTMTEQSATNLSREASASERLQQYIQRQTNLSRQKTQEEADLAQQQGTFGLNRASQTGIVRGNLGNIAMGEAGAKQELAGQAADFATQAFQMAKTEDEKAAQQQLAKEKQDQADMEAESKRLDLEKKRMEVRAAGAQQLSQGSMKTPPPAQANPPQSKPAQPKTSYGQFNQQNTNMSMPPQQQTGVQGILQGANQSVQKFQSTMDDAKKKAEQFKKNPLGAFSGKF